MAVGFVLIAIAQVLPDDRKEVDSTDCMYKGHQYTLSIDQEGKMDINHSLYCPCEGKSKAKVLTARELWAQ